MRKSVRMRPGAVWIAGLAALGLFTAWAIQRAVSSRVPMAAAYVAARTLSLGETLKPGDVRKAMVPAPLLPPDALAAPPYGKTVTTTVFPGQVLVAQDVGRTGGINGVMRLYGTQTRAYPISLSTASVPVSQITPGQAVDVIGSFPGQGGGNVTRVVAADAPVLAVNTAQSVILVGVTDAEALQIALAGKVFVALSPDTPAVPPPAGAQAAATPQTQTGGHGAQTKGGVSP